MQLLNEEQTYIKALIYGDPGSGKTTFGVTAPNPLILLSERQALASIREAANRIGVPAPPALYMSGLDDYREVLFALKTGKPGQELVIKSNGKEVLKMQYPETVIIDSLTDVGELAKADVERISPPQPGKDGLPTWGMRHWGALGDKMSNLILQFRNLPAHVLFLCLKDDREVGEGVDASRQVGPALPMRKLSAKVAAAVNVIGLTHRKTVREGELTSLHYEVHTTGPDYVMTKPYRPLRDVEEPNFSLWVRTIRSGQQKAAAAASPPPPTPKPTDENTSKKKETK